jgi:predicted phage gp36 major capsid-like protein
METEQQRAARDQMREHAERMEEEARAERAKAEERSGIDREVEDELQTVRPGSDAPSRAGITPDGSGADGERG